ncbi:MAG: iron-siderophore ABC transporter substrate-binding protein [Actinomycetota bacterium]
MSRLPLTVAAATAALALTACMASGEPDETPAATSGWETVTVDHAFGSTDITAEPEDVVTLGWGSTEAALALDVVPVGFEAQTYGVEENGVLPWVNEALEEVDAEPAVLPATLEEPAYEDIAALGPDLILAPYSGITADQYALLSEIAPTVVYPEAPWTTPWREVITIVGESLGKADEADALVADLEASVAAAAEAHPELDGLSVAAVWDVGGTFYVYKPADSRVDFLLDLGLVSAPAIEDFGSGSESSFYFTLSYEETDKLDADLLVTFASTEEEAEAFLAQSYAQAIPAVAEGAVATVIGDQLISAISPPNALSLPWGLDEYVAVLSEAATNL